jgi:hypothetical protein
MGSFPNLDSTCFVVLWTIMFEMVGGRESGTKACIAQNYFIEFLIHVIF